MFPLNAKGRPDGAEPTPALYPIFLALIRSELLGSELPDEIRERITPDLLIPLGRLADAQKFLHAAANALDRAGLLPEDHPATPLYREAQMVAVYRLRQQEQTYREVAAALDAAGIDFLPLKGLLLRPYYPDPVLRSSADLDLFVRGEDLDRASAVLTERVGCKLRASSAHDISFRAPNRVDVELHFDLTDEPPGANEILLDGIWEAATPSTEHLHVHEYRMDDARIFAYLVVHAAKHFLHGGCGIRPALDLWVLRHRANFAPDCGREPLDRAGLLPFADALERLSEVWFSGAEHTPLTRKMEEYLLRAGAYGSVFNRVGSERVRGEKKKRFVLRRLFPPYERMAKEYRAVGRYPILLPFYYLKRMADFALRGNRRGAADELRLHRAMDRTELEFIASLYRELRL